MRFSIEHHQDEWDLVIMKDEQTGTTVSILPQYGALLHEFSIRRDGKPVNIIDNYNGHAHLKKELDISFKSSKLSPFPCRIPGGKYRFNDTDYDLQHKFIDGSAIHGLLYNKPFKIIGKSSDDEKAFLSLQYEYQKDDSGYPFTYRCLVNYTLKSDHSLRIKTTVTNTNGQIIPIADGWHPYFKLGGKVDDWAMQLNADAIVEFDENLIPTGRLNEYHSFNEARMIGDMELDNCFVLRRNYPGAACRIFNPANGLTLSLFPDEAYPYLQLYIPPHRTSIAIENLSAAPDCFNNKMGLRLLSPGDSQSFTVDYQVTAD